MELKFYKLRICDADLILVDDLEGDGRDRDWEAVARALLHRRRGAGAERLAVLARAERDIWLRVFRADGAEAAAADAALCAARYLLDSGRSGSDRVRMRLSGAETRTLTVDVLDSASLGIALGPPRRIDTKRAAQARGRAVAPKPSAAPGSAGAAPGDAPGAAIGATAASTLGDALGASEVGSLATSIEASGGRFLVLPLRVGIPGGEGVAVFAEGGSSRAKARIAAAPRAEAPPPLPVSVVSRGELRIALPPSSAGLDSCAGAALALAAAAAVGYADREALVRMRNDALWMEWDAAGSLYAAARPDYVYRGEFHLIEDEEKSSSRP